MHDDGTYDLREVLSGWRDREEPKTVSKRDPSKLDRAALEDRRLALEVQKREVQLAEQTGRLVDREPAKATVKSMFHRVHTRLLSAPEELGSSLPA